MSRKLTLPKGQAQLTFAAGLIALVLLGMAIFSTIPRNAAARLLQEALDQIERSGEYTIIIKEEAQDYSIVFQGSMEDGGNLAGSIPAYNLEVQYRDGELLLRSVDTEDWQTAESLELQGLTNFLVSPLKLLQFQSHNFNNAMSGQELKLGNEICQTVYLDIKEKEEILSIMFPNIDTALVEKVTMGVALAKPGMHFRQARFLVEFKDKKNSLERTYYLSN